jgi:hypothetical protein
MNTHTQVDGKCSDVEHSERMQMPLAMALIAAGVQQTVAEEQTGHRVAHTMRIGVLLIIMSLLCCSPRHIRDIRTHSFQRNTIRLNYFSEKTVIARRIASTKICLQRLRV